MVDSVQFTIFNLIVQFTSMTTLRLEGDFGMYNMKQIVPSPLEFKYLTSRSALDYALTSALGLQSKSKRATRYNHEDTCIVPLTYKRRKGDSTFIRASERINQETKEMRAFCEQYTRTPKISPRNTSSVFIKGKFTRETRRAEEGLKSRQISHADISITGCLLLWNPRI